LITSLSILLGLTLLLIIMATPIVVVRERALRQTAEQERQLSDQRLYQAQLARAQTECKHVEAASAWKALSDTSGELRGWEYRYLTHHFQSGRRSLCKGGDPIESVAISPDGKFIAAVDINNMLTVWNSASLDVVYRDRSDSEHIGLKLSFADDEASLRCVDGGGLLRYGISLRNKNQRLSEIPIGK